MLKDINIFFSLLTRRQKRNFVFLQLLVLFMAIFEVLSIASIGPFMALIGDISLLETNRYLSFAYLYLGSNDPFEFLFFAGVLVLVLLSLSTIFSMLTTWRISVFSFVIGTEIADRLYQYYLSENWMFHSTNNSSYLTKQISTESVRVTSQVVLPFMQMIARSVLAFFIILGLFLYNPQVAFFSVLAFSSAYFVLYKVVKKKLIGNSKHISASSDVRYRLMNEGFGGIKDIIILNRADEFVNQFKSSGKIFSSANGNNIVLSQVPRYFIELLAFGGMIGLILFLIKQNKGDLSVVLPILAIYGLAGFKLLPALQQIYGSITIIKGNIFAFHEIKNDLKKSLDKSVGNIDVPDKSIFFSKSIEVKDVSFNYPNKNDFALKSISLTIPSNSTVAFVGPSGSGKSTLVDILLSLIEPSSGHLFVDGNVIDKANRSSWQENIGFVPQSIFLSDGSIAENIAFGLRDEDIDYEKVGKAVAIANLTELISSMPDGLETRVGERGVQLSGGQRQRIGIARALYNDPSILVLDEATSALDSITEKAIINSIDILSGSKTIIMIAHRLQTVRSCDLIFYMEEGRLVSKGTYDELLEINANFKKMAKS